MRPNHRQTTFGETTPIKIGRSLSVWQTRVSLEGGRDVVLVIQTQMSV